MVKAPNTLVASRAVLRRRVCPLVADDAAKNLLRHHARIHALLALL